jgi:muramidase (phage lysozyme)
MRLPKKQEDPRLGYSAPEGPRLPPKGTQLAGPPQEPPAAAFAMLDQPLGKLIAENKSKMSWMESAATALIPSSEMNKPLRQLLNEGGALASQIRPMLEARIKEAGYTPAHLDRALKTPPGTPPAAAPAQPPAAAAAPPAKQYALPPAAKPPAAAAPPVAAAAAPPVAPAGPAATAPAAAPAPVAAAPPSAAGAPGPRGLVAHHTGYNPETGADWKDPAEIVNFWKTQRPGIGAQYIMDRDGNMHDVKAEFGYGGTGHVHPGYTPKEMRDKGLVNKNLIGVEIMARDAKSVTPAQTKAFAEWTQKNHPTVDIYGHGELNPGHRDADEGISAKEAALALRKAGMPAGAAAAAAPAVAAQATAAAPTEPGEAASPGTGGKGPGSLDAVQKAFLSTIAKGEAKNYTTIYGGGQFSDFSKHPGQKVTANGYTSDAAGRYQFLGSTWREQAAKYGYTDFKPETQDKAAWNYASDTYKKATGRDMASDLASNDAKLISGVGDALKGVWPSLPGGSQENWKGAKFADVYGQNLGSPLEGSATAVAEGQGGIGSDAARTGEGSAPAAAATADAGGGDFAKGMGGIGDIFGGIADSMSKSAAVNNARASSPANLPLPSLPTPLPMMPMIDPKQAEMQRQQLAMAMQRLNSGKLF